MIVISLVQSVFYKILSMQFVFVLFRTLDVLCRDNNILSVVTLVDRMT